MRTAVRGPVVSGGDDADADAAHRARPQLRRHGRHHAGAFVLTLSRAARCASGAQTTMLAFRVRTVAALACCAVCFAVAPLSPVHAGDVRWDIVLSGSLMDPVALSSDTAGSSYDLTAPSGSAAPIDATSVRYLMPQNKPFGVPIREDRPYNAKQSWLGPDGELWMYGASGRTLRYNRESTVWSEVLPAGPYDSSTGGVKPIWGTRKLGNASVTPGERQGACVAVDSDGNAWLSGGGIVAGSGASADIFKLDSTTLIWSWEGGVNSNDGNYFLDPNFSAGLGNALPGDNVGPGPSRTTHRNHNAPLRDDRTKRRDPAGPERNNGGARGVLNFVPCVFALARCYAHARLHVGRRQALAVWRCGLQFPQRSMVVESDGRRVAMGERIELQIVHGPHRNVR